MKKYLKLFVIVIFLIVLCSCNNDSNKEVIANEHMTSTEKIGTKGEFLNSVNTYMNSVTDNYSIVLYSLELDESYGQNYAIYDKAGVTDINYPNYNAIATFSVNFEKNNDSAKVLDVLYTFPITYDENEDNLKVEYELYLSIIRGLLSKSSEDSINVTKDFFKMATFDDFKKIYNEEVKYDYRIVDIGDNAENYLSTLFLSDSKRITFEYHDSTFEVK